MLLKYPVSNPPSRHQLETLPRELYEEWSHRIGLGGSSIRLSPGLMATTLHNMHRRGGDYDLKAITDYYEKLQHLIYMLDEDE